MSNDNEEILAEAKKQLAETRKQLTETRKATAAIDKELGEPSTSIEQKKYRTEIKNGIIKPIGEAKKEELNLTCLSDVSSEHVEWLWYPYIPKGKLTIMLADPGVGKTTLCLKIASIISKGEYFFNESPNPFEKKKAGIVIYQTAEDGIADTIVPRLNAMGANMNNIFIISEDEKALSFSDDRIKQTMEVKHPMLMIFDPIQAYLGAGTDMHRANEVRPILSRLTNMAEQYRCSIILIAHMSKMSSNNALYRALGSVDIVALSRSEIILVNKPNEKGQKLMTHEKSSLASHGKSIEFHIDYNNGGIVFDGYSDLVADDVLGKAKENKRSTFALDEAKEFLQEKLSDGYANFEEIQKEAEEKGIKKNTIYRAKDELEIKHKTTGFGKEKKTIWHYVNYTIPKNNIS